ncbi:hypothetical protein GCM10009676_32160 [Prauserella halophila]|uniref:Type VII secretion system (Wss) protein ESAT-6 n=1 Tax=Prauserella halophila TaxID=185641 RepID=A0ABP4GZ65_9PSEU|nr:hypothetical protein [Prauserella halophila]MCP2238609.1 hypothetical protein [Prauserella halophila]
MAEEKTEAGGVEITTGDKSLGKTALESAPFLGGAVKTFDAGSKLTDGATPSEIGGLLSEGTNFISSCRGTAGEIAMDPIGWLVGQGLDFLISVCQPIQDAIHVVSGDGPALQQAADNFKAIGEGIEKLSGKFSEELKSSLQNWGGEASEAAGTKLADFSKGIDGVAGQAGDLVSMLQMSSMVMTVIEEFIKAILTELITWLIMIWIPALAAAVPTAGASTAAAGTATGVRAASTGSRVSRMVQKLQDVLTKIMDFVRRMRTRMGNLNQGVRQAMDHRKMRSGLADLAVQDGNATLNEKLLSGNGLVGERLQQGLGKSLWDAGKGSLQDQVGKGQNGKGKLYGNIGKVTGAAEGEGIGEDQSKSETEDHLDI